ncbi:MAG: restriction endonuclease, partial [bacterium]|nr:restriction endonuclease [bacterium]
MADHDATLPPPITRHDDDLAEADLEDQVRRAQGRENVRTGLEFEEQVADLFRLLGYQATVGYRCYNLDFDVRLEKSDPIDTCALVECKKWDKPVGQRDVLDFINKVGHARRHQPYQAVMVSRSGFTKGMHEIAKPESVQLLTLRELMLKLVDLGPNLAAAAAGFEGTELQRLYVEQDVVFQSAIRPGAEVEAAALTPAVRTWLDRG